MNWPLFPDDPKNKIAIWLFRPVFQRLMPAKVFEKGNASTRKGNLPAHGTMIWF
jgi:hypothetical protein